MPHLAFPFGPEGLDLEVVIGLDADSMQMLQVSGQAVPAGRRVRALIDSGSDATAVAPAVLQALGVPPRQSVQTQTAGGVVLTQTYAISLSIFGPAGAQGPTLAIPVLVATALQHAPPTIEALLGMDTLRDCLLIVDGNSQTFTLAFPPP
jgi:hypothetical protein